MGFLQRETGTSLVLQEFRKSPKHRATLPLQEVAYSGPELLETSKAPKVLDQLGPPDPGPSRGGSGPDPPQDPSSDLSTPPGWAGSTRGGSAPSPSATMQRTFRLFESFCLSRKATVKQVHHPIHRTLQTRLYIPTHLNGLQIPKQHYIRSVGGCGSYLIIFQAFEKSLN